MSVALLVYPIIMFAVILVIIAIYRSIYRNNMNRALEGEGSAGMMDLGQFIKTVVIIALIIMNIVTLSRLTTIQNSINNVNSNLSNQINNLYYRINSLTDEIEAYYEAQALVQEFEYELTDIDGTDALYHLEFTLSELDPGATVYLSLTGDMSNKIEIPSETLTYETDVVFQTDGLYTLNLLIEGNTIIQEELLELDVEVMLEQAISAQMYPDFWEEDNLENGEYTEKIQVVVANQLSYIESKQIDTVRFEVSYEGTAFYDETLTSPTVWDDSMEIYKMYDGDVEAFVVVLEQGDKDRWSQYETKCTITLNDGTVRVIYTYL